MYLEKVLGLGCGIATWNPEKRGLLATMKRFLFTNENLKAAVFPGIRAIASQDCD